MLPYFNCSFLFRGVYSRKRSAKIRAEIISPNFSYKNLKKYFRVDFFIKKWCAKFNYKSPEHTPWQTLLQAIIFTVKGRRKYLLI